MIILSKYLDQVNSQDMPLMEEVNRSASSGALRAAYIMVWIACAESIKRRFKEAGKRDHVAGKVSNHIEGMEKRHEAIDKILLEEAKKYGFIMDSEYTELLYIYNMRCIYGHPYELAPTEEQVIHAVSTVVRIVMSKPVKMREGFISQLLQDMMSEKFYLDDQERAIQEFAQEIMLKIDENTFAYMFEKYWDKLEKIAFDPTMSIFFRRGIIFTKKILQTLDIEAFSENEWHDMVCKFPEVMSNILSVPGLYHEVGMKAQDALVGQLIEKSKIIPSRLRFLQQVENELSGRQKERFYKQIEEISPSDLYESQLNLSLCFNVVIKQLSTRNWFGQNPAIKFIRMEGEQQISMLAVEQQSVLGRNILQAAEGGANEADIYIQALVSNIQDYPDAFIKGLILECFINESKEIRFKMEALPNVLKGLNTLDEKRRESIVDCVFNDISIGNKKSDNYLRDEEFERMLNILKLYSWTDSIRSILELKKSVLIDH